MVSAISYPNGEAVGAIDYLFDLSALSAANDDVWLQVFWNNATSEDRDANNVFLSLDNGATWALSVARLDLSTPVPPGWNEVLVDLSATLTAEGLDYSAQVLVRLQGG